MGSQGISGLERDVMECIWEKGRATVRDVMNCLDQSKSRAYTTIMTTMDRLFQKDLLVREREGNAYVYVPAQSRDSYWKSVAQETMQTLLTVGGDVALSAFVDAASQEDEKNLERLEQLIQSHRDRRGS
ncbi:MAG: BlaI/MecI/CopY family transcriptional regulator [Deltaproteobacteria bacterium]|nr:MAG: BlaI/MecI/CopY family transcriptional regulator [Deltaproteobacteria bacterium]